MVRSNPVPKPSSTVAPTPTIVRDPWSMQNRSRATCANWIPPGSNSKCMPLATARCALDGYETVIRQNGNNRLRHHIDHCSLIHPDDFQRFVDLAVTCTIWPPLNAPIDYNVNGIKPVLKPETWERMYANRERWDAGIRLVNHTDAPAATLWPWFGMEASITRGFPGKPEKGKTGPQHALTLEEVIQAYTINAAWSLRLEEMTGSIETGKVGGYDCPQPQSVRDP